MRSISSEEELAFMLSQEHSTICFFVDWSIYAVKGRQMFEELEATCSRDLDASFWVADVSDVDAPAAFLEGWLKKQDRPDIKMFNPVMCGNGSIAWLKRGVVVDFVQSATHHNLERLCDRTKEAFRHDAT